MFAIAVHDKKEDKLFLARDRIGIKPLYWGKIDDNFFFGSELKSIKKLKIIPKKINLTKRFINFYSNQIANQVQVHQIKEMRILLKNHLKDTKGKS
jgi:asparagine synthase (glutamine-hydrolysing)